MTITLRDNFSLGAAGLAEGTAANTFQVANILHYVINGRAYRKAVTDSIAFAAGTFTAFVAQAAQKIAVYYFFIDTAGAITVKQSAQVPNAQVASYVAGAFDWPDEPNLACIGALRITTNNAATFTPGSVDLGAADVVDVFFDVGPDYGVPVTY